MSLKDQITADMAVFLDTDEFSELHDINGQQVMCIIDTDQSQKRSNRQNDDYEGIYLHQITIFVREADLGYRPKYDQKMTVDGNWYIVIGCSFNYGMLEIILGANTT